MLFLAIITSLFWFAVLLDAAIGMRRLEKLEDVDSHDNFDNGPPLVSIVVAARNEEKEKLNLDKRKRGRLNATCLLP